jgi:hypothetical protein
VKNVSELLGLKQGTAWPAPLNVANVSPSYSWYHPLTYSHIKQIIFTNQQM